MEIQINNWFKKQGQPFVLKHLEENKLAPEISDSIRDIVISFSREDSFRKLLPARDIMDIPIAAFDYEDLPL